MDFNQASVQLCFETSQNMRMTVLENRLACIDDRVQKCGDVKFFVRGNLSLESF
jgi:hypothetical protein